MLAPGSKVSHERMGPGRVLRLLDDGRRALVRFDSRPGVPAVMAVAQLETPDSGPRGRQAPVEEPGGDEVVWGEALQSRGAPDRQTLEALRLGVVPRAGLHALTVGRHPEVARLEELLDRRRGLCMLLGGYGAGKSHMIELTEAEAHARGLWVARASFDPQELPPSHPLRLYTALMASLTGPDGTQGGLRPLLERVEPVEARLTGALHHRWLSPALFAVHHAPGELAEDVLAFVEGHGAVDHRLLSRQLRKAGYKGPHLLALPDYRTFGQIMAYLLSGVAAWTGATGHRGLVVLLDEAEALGRLGTLSRTMADRVLRYLAVASLPDEALSFDASGLYRGGHAVHRSFPPRYAEDAHLAVVCAFTPDPDIEAMLDGIVADEALRLPLPPLRPSLLPLLAEKVYGVVRQVHPSLDPEPEHRQRITKALAQAFEGGLVQSPRQAARLVVEFWDLYRVSPVRALRALHAAV